MRRTHLPLRHIPAMVTLVLVLGLVSSGCDHSLRRAVTDGSATPRPAVPSMSLASPFALLPAAAPASGSAGLCLPIPIKVSFDFDGPVPRSDRTDVRQASLRARAYYHVSTSSCAQERVVVFAHASSNRHAIALTHGWSSIEVFTKTASWLAASSTDRMVVMLHEWYHVVQARLASAGFSKVPIWLIEGSAEWSARKAASDIGLFATFDVPRASELALARFAAVTLARWKRFATPKDGRQRLLRFFKLMGERFAWPAAFRRAFGITARRFMRSFSAYRNRGFPR